MTAAAAIDAFMEEAVLAAGDYNMTQRQLIEKTKAAFPQHEEQQFFSRLQSAQQRGSSTCTRCWYMFAFQQRNSDIYMAVRREFNRHVCDKHCLRSAAFL